MKALAHVARFSPSQGHLTRKTPSKQKYNCACRFASSAARDYAAALWRLSQLQSNRTVTTTFDDNAQTSPPSKPKAHQDLNASAIPEMKQWLRRAGYTPRDLARVRHIHVAGTKGKGSVCAHATAMLAKYGAVGTFTSPHLVSPRERIAINGEPVCQELFASAFFQIWDRFTEAARMEGRPAAEAEGPASKPFFFRYLTILAWHIFLREGIKNVVMECGIGGEHDATNLLPPEAVSAAIVTQLGIDHVAMLGDTVEQIAWHKAGVFKSGVRAFTMKLDDRPSVMQVLRDRAAEKDAALVEVESSLVREWGGVESTLTGDFQKYNQALALLAVREHLGLGSDPKTALRDLPGKLVQGLREAKLRGRGEVLNCDDATWLLDGAHTKESLEEVAKWVARTLHADESVVLVFNQQERDTVQLLSGFLRSVEEHTQRRDVFSFAVFTRNELATPADDEIRDMSIQERAAEKMRGFAPNCRVEVFDNLGETVDVARMAGSIGPGQMKPKVLVTGSLHLVGGVLQILEPDRLL